MRLLDRLRLYWQITRLPVFAFIRQAFLGPGLPHDLNGFGHAFAALFGADITVSKGFTGPHAPAATDTEIQPAVRQDVTRGALRGDMKGMVQRRLKRQRAKANALRVLCRRNRDHEGVGHRAAGKKHRLGQPGAVETELFSQLNLFYRFPMPPRHCRALKTRRLPKRSKPHVHLLLVRRLCSIIAFNKSRGNLPLCKSSRIWSA